MTRVSVQAPNAVVLVRPHRFHPNPQTAADNAFQRTAPSSVAVAAYQASTELARRLSEAGVLVHLFEDDTGAHPDSVFPNNWFSTHHGGRIAVYPMFAANRRGERRADVIDFLKHSYRVQEVVDYSGFEPERLYLEGTGAMVLDHSARVAYAARSLRSDPLLLERFCTTFGYESELFDALDSEGRPIYHTNVMMCIATDFALVCLESIVDPVRRADITHRLEASGRTVLPLTLTQVREFAGNAIELRGRGPRRLLAISARAAASLSPSQLAVIESSCDLLTVDIAPIELAGGSVRCMIAGIHLDPRSVPTTNPAPALNTADDVAVVPS